jgi:hypothetical protein
MCRAWRSGVLVAFVWCFSSLAPAALGFSDGRVFEQVSPTYKGGSGATHIEAVGQNGEGAAFYAPAAFAGAPAGLTQNIDFLDYLAQRGASGWSTVPVMPPAALMPAASGNNRDITPDMSLTLALGNRGPNNEAGLQEGTESEFLFHVTASPDTSANWSLAGKILTLLDRKPLGLRYLGADQNFCHLFFDEFSANEILSGTEVLLEEAENANRQLFELTSGCNGEPPVLRLVSLKNNGELISPVCRADLGIEGFGEQQTQAFNAVSEDGDTVFFTTCIENDSSAHQLFVRLGGSQTVEVSKSLTEICHEEIPCGEALKRANADFVGASKDGSKVFFTTTASLDSTTDSDNGNDLYMARIGCPSGEGCSATEHRVTGLVQVSHDPNGGEAGVQGVVRIAPDGSRVYFVAEGDLLTSAEQGKLESERRPTPGAGADNLYEYDGVSGAIEFVGDLCSGHGSSGLAEDSHCPSERGVDTEIWLLRNDGQSEAQTAGADGRYLVFSSYGQLASDDTDASRDIYRFDAITGTTERVSSGEDGYDANGNGGEVDASILPGHSGGSVSKQYEMSNRAISEDGSRIVFETAEALSPLATNSLVNVYEWHESPDRVAGGVSLLSGGNGSIPVEDAVMAPGGRDVFFITSQGLVPQDVDGAPDVYDARLGGGFAPLPASPEPCSGDACQGPLTNPVPLLVPSSVSQTPGENLRPPKKGTSRKAKCRRGYKHDKRGRCAKTKKRARKAAIAHRGIHSSIRGGRS